MSHHMMLVMFISGAALAAPPVLICIGFIVMIIRQRRTETATEPSPSGDE
jgi:hypothetical protein